MLKTLLIKNLILIEHADISFEQGLTILTGETGAGKTAFVQALRLIMGDRADASKVRKGAEKAFIQASFELNHSLDLMKILEDLGVEYSPKEEELILTRELHASGKSRALISGQTVPLSALQKIAPYLMDFISQHEQITLKNADSQRDLLDLFADVDLSFFRELWEEEKQIEKNLEALKQLAQNNQKIAIAEKLEELQGLNLQDGEEESLFQEYTLLTNSQEIQSNAGEVLELADQAISSSVQIQALIRNISKYTTALNEGETMGKEAHFQLAELRSLVERFSSNIETDPNRLTYLENRLEQIDRLKKKYGNNLIAAEEKLKEQFEKLETIEDQIASLSEALTNAKIKTSEEASRITKQRGSSARKLEQALSSALQRLNIPSAEVSIEIAKQTRSYSGEDAVNLLLKANRGEQLVPVKDTISGGELSRLLFSFKVILAEKSEPQTMIFDEIDANVGGKTGSVMGKELHELGKKRQVFCITHFPQVARYGDHHFRVYKEEKADRTNCTIEPLTPSEREEELVRMLGGVQSTVKATP